MAGGAALTAVVALTAGPAARCRPAVAGDRPYGSPIVQGNVPRLGLEFNAQRRAVLDNHVNATLGPGRRRRRRPGRSSPTSSSGRRTPATSTRSATPTPRGRIDEAADAIGVPILVGGLLRRSGPDGPPQRRHRLGPGHRARPDATSSGTRCRSPSTSRCGRSSGYITDKVDLVRTRLRRRADRRACCTLGPATIGDVICFEVAYDEVVRDTVTGGAQLLVVQTNNATFDEAEARQQLAMVRLRAVEHGRPALMASTVGVSAFVDAAGAVYDATQLQRRGGHRTGPDVCGRRRTVATDARRACPELALVGCVAAVTASCWCVGRPAWRRR